MAAQKPSTAKKKTTTSAAKTTAKKAPAKKTTAKAKTAVKSPAKKKTTRAASSVKSTHAKYGFITKEQESFFSTRFTLQTVYWAIFAAAIIALSLWTLKMQIEILDLLQQIDTISNEPITLPAAVQK